MEKFIREDAAIKELIETNRIKWITSPNNLDTPEFSEARHHGDFDNDNACFKSTVQRILGNIPATIPVVRVEEMAKIARATALPPVKRANTQNVLSRFVMGNKYETMSY